MYAIRSYYETQGTNGTRYDCDYATIASPVGKCVIQRYEPGATLTWNAALGQWDGAYDPETGFGFAQELNVGGVITSYSIHYTKLYDNPYETNFTHQTIQTDNLYFPSPRS